jgi:hypothetical protein
VLGAQTANILNKVAQSVQANKKKDLREVYLAPNRASAEVAIDVFAEKYGAKYDTAVDCLTKDRNALLAHYDFPAEHWDHLRTTNPIESVLATVRHRTARTKGSLSSTTDRHRTIVVLPDEVGVPVAKEVASSLHMPGHPRINAYSGALLDAAAVFQPRHHRAVVALENKVRLTATLRIARRHEVPGRPRICRCQAMLALPSPSKSR